jgi:hypothetical protein
MSGSDGVVNKQIHRDATLVAPVPLIIFVNAASYVRFRSIGGGYILDMKL